MLGKTKNFLFNLCKKKTILFVFFFSFFGLTFARSASAGWVKDLLVGFATLPIFSIVWLAVKFAVWWTGFAGSFLNWVLSPNFISLSYTNPANNPIIKTGLGVTQGFVNMLLVLILVYIAIATILRLAGYETKKLLITFIIVALLVNFAPVICGLIVDASNIVMNFFIQDLKADAFGKAMGAKVDQISFEFDESLTMTNYKYILQLAIMVPFLLVLGNILFLFALIFILRYLVIWLLVILSPLAFACYILPVTRKYFDKWWEQFINWSIIGITCGFFLYLALLLVVNIPTSINPPTTEEGTLFNAILPYFVSVIFLGLGAVFGLQTSAMGASTAISVIKRGQKWTGRRGKWVAKEGAKKIGRGIRPVVEGRARKLAAGAYSTMVKIGNWSPTGGEFKPGAIFKWAAPKMLKDFGNLRPVIDKGMKDADGQSGRVIGDQIANQKVQGAEATGWYSQLLKQNDSQDLFDAFRRKVGKGVGGKKWKDMSDKEIADDASFHRIMAPILTHAKNSGKLGSTLRRDARLAKVAYEKDIGSYGKSNPDMKSPQQAIIKAVREARDHIKDWEPETLEDPEVLMACLAQFDRDRWLQINRQVKNGQNTALKAMDKVFADFKQKNKAKLSGKSDQKIWDGEFREFIKTNYGGDKYFIAVKESRMQNTGWREAEKPAPKTPGKTIMDSPPPEEKTKPLKSGEKTKEEKENEPKK